MVKEMEQNPEQTNTPAITRIDPPGEARVTTILNGIGNGAMIAGVPFLLLNLYEAVVKGGEHSMRNKVGLGLTVTGCLVGGVMGTKEAHRLQEYRNRMSDQMAVQDEQIAQTKMDLSATRAELKRWTSKEIARKESKPTEPAMSV
jgi:hypothetical protein